MSIHEILQDVWGYPSFRPLQQEIIESALSGKDTLAILPTGGGKSLTYQVPALAQDGLCIVVSPLVALIQDQVKQLRARDIRATMVVSGMTNREIDHAYGNCIHGDYKLLYVSPERLQNETFLRRYEEMNVNLIAVDEAHCISQWGYDFRPTYLEIDKLRETRKVPVLALTATATPEVSLDIQEKLNLKDPTVFQGGVERSNLSFQVREVPDKFPKLVEILQFIRGTSIVYTMSRKSTQLIAKELQQQGFSATAYHAGLNHKERKARQKAWIEGKTRIIVATNAFGMGIDKADVRAVIHYHVPESLEAYYQEAGRAGRDGKNALAVLLTNEKDHERLKQSAEERYPTEQVLRNILIGLFQYLKINFGDGPGRPHEFNIYKFAKKFDLPLQLTHYSVDALVRQGWISVSDPFYSPSRFRFKINNTKLYRFQVNTPKYEKLIKFMLRNFTGVFEQSVKIDEEQIAKYLQMNVEEVKRQFTFMHQNGIAAYYEQSDYPLLNFLIERPKGDDLRFDKEQLEFLRTRHQMRISAMVEYASTENASCRMQFIQRYFGEKQAKNCEICDVCMAEKNKDEHKQITAIEQEILSLLAEKTATTQEVEQQIGKRKAWVRKALQHLLAEEQIQLNDNLWRKK